MVLAPAGQLFIKIWPQGREIFKILCKIFWKKRMHLRRAVNRQPLFTARVTRRAFPSSIIFAVRRSLRQRNPKDCKMNFTIRISPEGTWPTCVFTKKLAVFFQFCLAPRKSFERALNTPEYLKTVSEGSSLNPDYFLKSLIFYVFGHFSGHAKIFPPMGISLRKWECTNDCISGQVSTPGWSENCSGPKRIHRSKDIFIFSDRNTRFFDTPGWGEFPLQPYYS